MSLFGSAFDSLGNALNVLTAKHAVIAGNVANVDTPGYKAKVIDFKEAFFGAVSKSGTGMKSSNSSHFNGSAMESSLNSFIKEQENNSLRNDGNNVNIDKEMMGLSQNGIMYEMAVQLLSKKFDLLKYAISEGRRA
jgi:flagellar basal-body rod protein FlgB